jgi:chaperonin cofactor prefoldin
MGVINPMLHHDDREWSTDRPESYEHHSRGKSVALWIIVATLAAVLGALVYYGYRTVQTQDARITQMFGNQGTAGTLGQRADAAESKLHDLAGNWEGMGQRVTKLEGRVAADARETRRYAETLTQQLHQQMSAELNARASTLDARLQQVESEEAAQRTQMAQVEASLKQEISAARDEDGRDLSGVRQQAESNARDVSAISQKLDRRRIDFELTKGQTKELAPGISLQVRGTNIAHQRYHGALLLPQEQRTVWLRDKSAREPVRFFQRDGGEPYELVVTDVTKKGVSGYLLAPVRSDAASATNALTGEQTEGGSPAHE